MMRAVFALTTVVFLASGPPQDLAAQAIGDDVATLALHLGAVAPATTLPDGAAYDGGLGGGISGAYWFHRNVGVRANALFGKTAGNQVPGSPAAMEDPSVGFFGGEVALRYPMGSGRLSFAPYVGLGGGAKTYDWSEDSTGFDSELTFAWNLTGGLDVRPASSPVGFLVEVRRYSSKYKWHNLFFQEPTVNDYFLTAGITLSH